MMEPTYPMKETMDALSYECKKQARLLKELENQGYTCLEDPSGLYGEIGKFIPLKVYCSHFTPRLLCKLYVEGMVQNEVDYFLVPVWQIVKFGNIIPQEGAFFETSFVIGVRRIGDKHFVPCLRLPLS